MRYARGRGGVWHSCVSGVRTASLVAKGSTPIQAGFDRNGGPSQWWRAARGFGGRVPVFKDQPVVDRLRLSRLRLIVGAQ